MAITTNDRKRIFDYIRENDPKGNVLTIKPAKDFLDGEIQYAEKIVSSREIKSLKSPEEWVKAYLLVKLFSELSYPVDCLEIEKEFPVGKNGKSPKRSDILVYDKRKKGDVKTFLFIECKEPDAYEKDKKSITGQLFNLGAIENNTNRVKYLVYYTVDFTSSEIKDKALIVDYEQYKNYDQFLKDNENSLQLIPANYGQAKRLQYICGDEEFGLDTTKDATFFSQLRKELHDTLWGGTTDYNSIFSNLTKLLLAKIHDELNTPEGQPYEFQITEWDGKPESANQLFDRITKLYKKAQKLSLYQTDEVVQDSPAINREKINESKVYFVVQKLQGISLLHNEHVGVSDILGNFFEGIISQGFKQDKGTFFTHVNIVRFMIEALDLEQLALKKIQSDLSMPYIIDPSCGSGTFLIDAMKHITKKLRGDNLDFPNIKKTAKIKERLSSWFLSDAPNVWAKEFIYGIESDVDLTLATKVNMVLHGDGNINIFNRDGLKHFDEFQKILQTGQLEPTKLSYSHHLTESSWSRYELNEQFDVLISNPPFSIKVTESDQQNRDGRFFYNNRKNSENLFIERWYQLLAPEGRMAVVLPESVFDTTENKYIRLFLYKYFNVKAIVSLPQLAFEPFTSTKTSLLFAQKKNPAEIAAWENQWKKAEKVYAKLRDSATVKFALKNDHLLNQLKKLIAELDLDIYFIQNCIDENLFTENVRLQIVAAKSNLPDNSTWLKKPDRNGQDRFDKLLSDIQQFISSNELKSVTDAKKEIDNLKAFLRFRFPNIKGVNLGTLVETAYDEIIEIASLDYPDVDNAQPYTNSWWVFAEVCQELNPPIIFAEAQSIGYKRTKRGENPKPNNLYQVSANGEVTFDTKNPKAILDYIKRGNIWQ